MSDRAPSASAVAALDTGAARGASSREAHSCARCDGTLGDPFAAAFALGASAEGWRSWIGYCVGAILLQTVLATASVEIGLRGRHVAPPIAQTTSLEIDVAKEEPPPPPPPEKEEPAPPTPAPPVVRTAPVKEAPPPAQAAAKASAVVTAAPDPNEPVDLTGNTIVVGNSDSYAGGGTMANGTSDLAVRTRIVAPTAIAPAAKRAAEPAAPLGPDLSRTVQYTGGSDWNCPFPPEADTAQIDDRFVKIQIAVAADGSLQAVTVLENGDHGFARAAETCARRHTYGAAFDRDGKPIPGTKTFRVHFER